MFDFITIKEVQINLGKWCKSLRRNEKLTQEELANKLAVSRLTLSNLENGKNFTIDTFLKVMQHFGELEKINELAKNNTFDQKSFY